MQKVLDRIEQSLEKENQKLFEYIIFDTPSGRTPLLLAALQKSEYAIIPTDISPTSIKPLEDFMQFMHDYSKCVILGVVITRWQKQLGEMGIYSKYKELLERFDIELFASGSQIDHDIKVLDALDQRTSILTGKGGVKRQVKDFVDSILSRINKKSA